MTTGPVRLGTDCCTVSTLTPPSLRMRATAASTPGWSSTSSVIWYRVTTRPMSSTGRSACVDSATPGPPTTCLRAAETTAVIMFLVSAAGVSAWLITTANIPQQLAELVEPIMGNKMLLTFVLMMLVLVVGTALDFTPTVLILTPVLMPVVLKAGIDPVYFGVLFIINNAIGLITPPVGTVLNVVCGVARITMDDAFKGVMPFFIAQLIVLFAMVFFPQIVTVPLSWWMAR